jgi:hypothetical protein
MAEEKTIAEELKDLLADADARFGGEIYLNGAGTFLNRRCEGLSPYDVLVKIEGLKVAVERAKCLALLLPY